MESTDDLTMESAPEPPASGDDSMWTDFVAAKDAAQFYVAWLALQCREIQSATAGLLLLQRPDGTYGPAAVWPVAQKSVVHLKEVAQRALLERRGVIEASRTEGLAVSRVYVAYPIDINGSLHGVAVL